MRLHACMKFYPTVVNKLDKSHLVSQYSIKMKNFPWKKKNSMFIYTDLKVYQLKING